MSDFNKQNVAVGGFLPGNTHVSAEAPGRQKHMFLFFIRLPSDTLPRESRLGLGPLKSLPIIETPFGFL
jgi:hypothetical protein